MRTIALPRRMNRRPLALVALAAALVLLAGYLGAVSLTAGAADTLLSQGRPVTASSIEGPAFPAADAVDGDMNSRWSSQFSSPQWIQVDLGSTASITRVVLRWEAAYATAFQIQISTDALTWTPVYSTTTGPGGGQTLDVSGTGRYVRMYGTARATGYGFSLWEFQVYGNVAPIGATCDTSVDAAMHRPATSSSAEGPGLSASGAVDGDLKTRWSSQFSDPQWIQIDLGAPMSICQVVLNWEAAYGRAYQIQTSSDAQGWTTIYSTDAGSGGTETRNVSGQGRYLRVYGTARATGYGYSLWEVGVHVAVPTDPPSPTGPSGAPAPAPSTTPPANWTKIFGDDFTGTAGAAPESANWITETGGPATWGTGEVETMTNAPANVSLDGSGHLALTAVNSGGGWTSGRVDSQRADFAAAPGGEVQITAVLRQPDTADSVGYWPAFRTLGAGYRADRTSWPGTGEVDVMEDVNGLDEQVGTLHCGVNPGGVCNEPNGLGTGLASCAGCQTGYHTYSEVIDRSLSDEQVRWYLDGQQIGIVSESQVGVDPWQRAVDHGFFLVFDLAVGGGFPDAVCGCHTPTAATASGGTLSVDSVAVYTTTGPVPAALTTPPRPTGPSRVQVTGGQGNWRLTVDGAPYQIKGVTFGPDPSVAAAYLPDLESMGVNTLRTWGTGDTTGPLLDAASRCGLKVINGFWLNQNSDYVNDTAYKTSTLNSIVAAVNTYKNDSGVLMWDVGNEVLLTLQNTYSGAQLEQQRNAYAAFVDQVAQAIHAADPNHPVTSTDAWTGAWPYYRANAPHLDLYAVNAYGSACNVKQDWIDGGYTKPYILTEAGPSGEWEVPNDANGRPDRADRSAEGRRLRGRLELRDRPPRGGPGRHAVQLWCRERLRWRLVQPCAPVGRSGCRTTPSRMSTVDSKGRTRPRSSRA